MTEVSVEKFKKDALIAKNIISGNTNVLLQLIKEGWDINEPLIIDEDGHRYLYILPLMFALYKCVEDSVRFLVIHKAKLDVGSEHAFLYAIRYTYDTIIEYLVKNKAKVNVYSYVYANAYMEAYIGHKYNHFSLIEKYGLPASQHARDTVNTAVLDNNYRALDILIGLSVNLNDNKRTKNNFYGQTPLIYSIHHSDISMIRYLLGHGADPNYPNLIGKTPYTIAIELNRQDILFLF